MLDPRERRRAGAKTLLAGALVLAVAGAWLLYSSIDWLRHGCDCDESLMPDWTWTVLMALAVASFAGALTLAARAASRRAG